MTPTECSKIMVIDDDPGVLTSVKRILERQGYCVEVHDGGPGCFKEVARFEPDLVLVDVNMPFLSGDAFVSLFGQCPGMAQSSIVLYSAADEFTLQQKVIYCGAQGYISKADSGLEFARKIASFLRKSQSVIQKKKAEQRQ
jgi:DNA-binding response OmpR family regulator